MGGGDNLMFIAIQAMLGLAIFSFLEYCIRTSHAPEVVNRRAKLICAGGLTLSVLGMWLTLYHPLAGLIMTVSGMVIAVATMFWLEMRVRRLREGARKRASRTAPPGARASRPQQKTREASGAASAGNSDPEGESGL